MDLKKVLYWAATGVMCLIFLYSAYNYFFNYEMITGFFQSLGFPIWLVYPLAILKVLGVVAVLSRKSPMLKEWAYAGFFFDAAMALTAHKLAEDGAGMFAIIALVATIVSRFMEPKVFSQ